MPSESRGKKPRALNLEKRVYTRSPLASANAEEDKSTLGVRSRGPALVLPASPQPGRLLTPKSEATNIGSPVSPINAISPTGPARTPTTANSTSSSLAPEPTLDERRLSGVGTYDVGLGLLSDTLSDSDSDHSDQSDAEDEEETSRARILPTTRATSPLAVKPAQQQQPVVGLGIRAPVPLRKEEDMAAKHRALFEAATASAKSPPPPLSPLSPLSPPPPSYVSPVHRPALQIAMPAPSAQQRQHPPYAYTSAGPRSPAPPYLTPPLPAHHSPQHPPPLSPHPLPPSSPITALFAAPRGSRFSIPLSSPSTPQMGSLTLMRSEKEDALPVARTRQPPRQRQPSPLAGGIRSASATDTIDDGSAFWRRFSLVVKTESALPPSTRKSPWLAQRLRTSRLTRRLLVLSVTLFCLVLAGGVIAAWFFTHRSGDGVDVPIAVGGSAGETGIVTSSTQPAVSPWMPPDRRAAAVETGEEEEVLALETGWAEVPMPTAFVQLVGLQ